MKKIIVAAVCALCVLTATAQNSYRRGTTSKKSKAKTEVTYGIRAGLNVANIRYSDNNYSSMYGNRCGFNIGVIADVPLYKHYVFLEPGLYLTMKGGKASSGYEKNSANPTYLELPILFSGRLNITRSIQGQLNFGPYIACGLFGNRKWSNPNGTWTYGFFNEYNEGRGSQGYRRFDCGLDLGAGFTFSKKYYIGFIYEFGLVSMYPSNWYEAGKWRNRNCMIDIGYNF